MPILTHPLVIGSAKLKQKSCQLLLEQELSHLIEASSPCKELVSGTL